MDELSIEILSALEEKLEAECVVFFNVSFISKNMKYVALICDDKIDVLTIGKSKTFPKKMSSVDKIKDFVAPYLCVG